LGLNGNAYGKEELAKVLQQSWSHSENAFRNWCEETHVSNRFRVHCKGLLLSWQLVSDCCYTRDWRTHPYSVVNEGKVQFSLLSSVQREWGLNPISSPWGLFLPSDRCTWLAKKSH
jgi:hypothetical protein